MKKFLRSRLGIRATKGSVAAGAIVLASNANAALPTEATDAINQVIAFATDIIAASWPVVALVTVGIIGIGLFKKFIKKSAS